MIARVTPQLAPGHRLIHFDEIDSTNAEAHRRAQAGERGPLWIWAERQTQGRGRLGRGWVSEPGNLYASLLFAIDGDAALASQISFVAALAVHDTVRALSRHDLHDLKLKWPNDVLLAGEKFSGILPEAIAGGNGAGTLIVLGCGINLAHAPGGLPYPVTALARHGIAASPRECLSELSYALARCLEAWNDGAGFPAMRQAWLSHAIGLGGSASTGETSGTFTGLASDGALLLTLPDGTSKAIHAGEVRFAALDALRGAS